MEGTVTGPLLPIIRPTFMSPNIEQTPNNVNNDGLVVRCCRRKYTCIFTAMILLIVFLSFINDVLKRLDEESFFNVNNLLKVLSVSVNKTELSTRP